MFPDMVTIGPTVLKEFRDRQTTDRRQTCKNHVTYTRGASFQLPSEVPNPAEAGVSLLVGSYKEDGVTRG